MFLAPACMPVIRVTHVQFTWIKINAPPSSLVKRLAQFPNTINHKHFYSMTIHAPAKTESGQDCFHL